MRHDRLEGMVKGWFVGDFSPTVLRSKDCEVAIKQYAAGAHEAAHYHAVATELTAIVSGRARMLGREWGPGDIVTVEPGEATDFTALTDVVTVVVKLPSAPDDKFLVEPAE
jgi:hypothetical protein